MTNNPSSFIRKWRVSQEEIGMSLLAFLRKKNPDAISVKSLKRAIDGKRCTVNGKIETFSSHPLKKGDLVSWNAVARDNARKRSLLVLYEDQDLLIVDKPAGLVCENRYFIPLLKQRASLIHRLDKETSGIVMLAKHAEIMEEMIALFREKKILKKYLAVVDGNVVQKEGKIENFLRKKAHCIPGQVMYEVTRGKGALAITCWKCLKTVKNASLILCEPITGRTHQLRIHLSAMGHPILGDIQYGKRFRCPLHPERQLLHAYSIAFIHPKTRQPIFVESPIPLDFEEALKALSLRDAVV